MIPIEKNDVDNKFNPGSSDTITIPLILLDEPSAVVLCQTIQDTITTIRSGTTFLYHSETDTPEIAQKSENQNRISELTIILEKLIDIFPNIIKD